MSHSPHFSPYEPHTPSPQMGMNGYHHPHNHRAAYPRPYASDYGYAPAMSPRGQVHQHGYGTPPPPGYHPVEGYYYPAQWTPQEMQAGPYNYVIAS